jgi:hypothetical protein
MPGTRTMVSSRPMTRIHSRPLIPPPFCCATLTRRDNRIHRFQIAGDRDGEKGATHARPTVNRERNAEIPLRATMKALER